jgi:hypothetical protein
MDEGIGLIMLKETKCLAGDGQARDLAISSKMLTTITYAMTRLGRVIQVAWGLGSTAFHRDP